MSKTIAILDDEPDILELVSVNLEKTNFKTKKFSDTTSFMKYLKSKVPDLILLDLMLPDGDGLEICKNLKNDERFANVPILMLTAKGDESDKVVGLELGADDYITKPFSPKELVARIKAVLRRSEGTTKNKRIVVNKDVVIDLETYEVEVSGETVELTSTEFKILKMLAEKRGRVFSREQILDYLWGTEKVVIDRTVDVHIRHLRKKLGIAGELIQNIRGVGYKLK